MEPTFPATPSCASAFPAPRLAAACVVGAVRSFIEPQVQQSFTTNIAISGVDLFYYLMAGEEVSARGQSGELDASALHRLHRLTNHGSNNTRVVRVQILENKFRCGQMATGRFFKISRCASDARRYAEEHGVQYGLFLLIRPDVVYDVPFRWPAATCMRNCSSNNWWSYHQEVIISPFQNIRAFESLAQARCCDLERRLPKACFTSDHAEPWISFLIKDHFARSGMTRTGWPIERLCTPWQHRIVRSERVLQLPGIDWTNLSSQHGVYRTHVEQVDEPPAHSPLSLIAMLRNHSREHAAHAHRASLNSSSTFLWSHGRSSGMSKKAIAAADAPLIAA